ncbi:MAG: hypothetical protein KDK78_03595 [Chlamydiia bacterium]|nr:hypothetical protein [Chlamydiia bacterium]
MTFSIGTIQRLSVHLHKQEGRMNEAMNKLSTGRSSKFTANRAIADKLQLQAHGIAQGALNAVNNSARINQSFATLDQGMDLMGSMADLAVRANDGSLSDADRQSLQAEFSQLHDQLNSSLGSASYNGKEVLKGETVSLQTDIAQSYQDADSQPILNALSGADISTQAGASAALDKLYEGAQQMQLQGGNLAAASESMTRATDRAMGHAAHLEDAAWSIGDANLAQDIAEFVAASTAHNTTLAVLHAHNTQLLNSASTLLRNF